MDTLFENYECFIKENSEDLSSPQGSNRLIVEEGMYRAYVEALTENLEPHVKAAVVKILDRNREDILTESANVPGGAFASGWTVLSFPILVDIYAQPIIAELCNIYPTDSPIVSIPRVVIKAITKSYDGSTTDERVIPTARNEIRAGQVDYNVVVATPTNLYTALTLSSDEFTMNRRYTLVTAINVTDSGGTATGALPLSIRADSRSQFVGESAPVTTSNGGDVVAKLNGRVDFNTGDVIFNVYFEGAAGDVAVMTADTVSLKLRFVPISTMNGRTVVRVETEMTDVTIDPSDDFLIDLPQESIQDYKSIFKIDLLRTLSDVIRRQILLNKDYDLAFFLEASEADMATNGTVSTIDLTPASPVAPASVVDIFKNVVPKISTLMGLIYRNFNIYPSYLISGLKTASLLRSLQDVMVTLPGKSGEIGWTGSTSQFMKLKILESSTISDSKIYISTKAPSNSLEKSTIIDLVYKPLYIVKEVTDGQQRNFIRSRTSIEVARTDGLGLLNVQHIDNYL